MATATATATPSFLSRAKAPQALPPRVVLYGVEGVGKSTFGAQAPNPIFLAAEDGIRHLGDVLAFELPKDLKEIYSMFAELAAGGHDRKTLVIDTMDWMEPIIARSVCERNNWKDIESPGYGKGYDALRDEWRLVLAALDRVRMAGIEIICLAHASVTTFQNPAGADYSRYELAMHKKSASVIKQWADFVLFANFDDFVATQRGRDAEVLRKGKGVSTGNRVLYATHHAAWDAKARGTFPESLPLDYAAFTEIRMRDPKSALPDMCKRFDALLGDLNPDEATRAKILGFVGDRTDPKKMEGAINRLGELISQKNG